MIFHERPQKCAFQIKKQTNEKARGHTWTPTLRSGQYLMYAHSHITQAVAVMDGCFVTGYDDRVAHGGHKRPTNPELTQFL